MLDEILYASILFAWVLTVVLLISRKSYEIAKKKAELKLGVGEKAHYVGVYFARKIIHILAGGLVALLIPMFNIFKTPIIPSTLGLILALLCYIPHKTGKLMYWFQDPNNIYEVNFSLIWASMISIGWVLASGSFWLPAIPLIFMSWGDGVTGIVRNLMFKKRGKHWIGNLAMFLICAPIGYLLSSNISSPVSGLVAASIASLVEHFEKIGNYIIDDNITVPLSSFTILFIAKLLS
ncbi:dolichol kinase [Candidatus Bathyarchaeota archaeon]|nr:dolichol kinase [Candidatus Bathyarchaeota archaeon]